MNPERISPELEESRKKIEADAKEVGLDFFNTVFYVVDYKDMNQLISYDGFPVRYHHWNHGMKSLINENQYRYGLSKVFELVLNTDYCNAFLLKNNSEVEDRFVIAHVYGHCDFFKNNLWFSMSNRDMIKEMARHAEMIEYYEDKCGWEKTEKFLDRALSMDTLIDPYSQFKTTFFERLEDRLKEGEEQRQRPKIIETGDKFIDKLLNTPEHFEKEKARIDFESEKRKRYPREMQKDVMKFLIDNARLSNPNLPEWKIDILRMIRDESYYFAPQRMTKIMNEGWAAYWHHQLMTHKGHAGDDGFFEFSRLHSSVVSIRQRPGPINPYALGLALWRWIEEKWDTGRHGPLYDNCDSLSQKMGWDTKDMKGREMMFHVRKYYNDILFINEFLDQDFCDANKLWKYGQDEQGRVVIETKDANVIKKELIAGIYNSGEPLVYVKDGNYQNRGQLLLYHDFDFDHQMIDLEKSLPVLKNIRHVWGRDVCLETKLPYMGDEESGTTLPAYPLDDDEDDELDDYVKTVIMCTEKTFVFMLYDEEGKLIEQREMPEDT